MGQDFLVNEEDKDNDGYSRVGLDFLESYSRAPATDYRRQVTPSHAKKTNIGKKCKKGMQQKVQKRYAAKNAKNVTPWVDPGQQIIDDSMPSQKGLQNIQPNISKKCDIQHPWKRLPV